MKPSSSTGLSILIPAHNASSTISSTLISALFTRPRTSEILVYLDGGETSSKIMSFLETKGLISVYRGNFNQGISSAMNFLISKARFDLVTRLDADDIALPCRYFGAFRKIRSGKADLIFSNSVLFGQGLRKLPIVPQFPFRIRPDVAPFFLLQSNPFVQSTMIAKKQVLVEAGGYVNSLAEDFELFLRLADQGFRLERSRMFGVLYRIHANQVSGQANFREKVYSESLIKKRLGSLEAKFWNISGKRDSGKLQTELRVFLETQSFGFWLRNKFLEPPIRVVLGITGLWDRGN